MTARRPTIKDIAREADLSPSTITRALNDHPGISQRTKAKVLDLAKKMDYAPNMLARGLVKRRSSLLGLLVYDFRNGFYPDITRVIQNTAEEWGYWIVQASTDDDQQKAHSLINSMIRLGVEGIIYASTSLDDMLVEKLIDDRFPIVLTARRLRKAKGHNVILNNLQGAYLAVRHLIRLGYRRIGMIAGPLHLSTGLDRSNGYFRALREHNIAIEEGTIRYGSSFSRDSGYCLAKNLMGSSDLPDAIFCQDDDLAIGVMRALGERGLGVPEDVALVGFDDVEIASHPRIQLTTVNHNVQEMGRLATKMLVEAIRGETWASQSVVLEPHLVIRRSCGYGRPFQRREVK